MLKTILTKIRSKIRSKHLAFERWSVHNWHRRSHKEDYQLIDSYVEKYRALGGLRHPWQHYKLFQLRELLKVERPESILELGTGTTTIVFAEYVRNNQMARLTCVDESKHWLANSCQLAEIDDSNSRFCMIAADKLFIGDSKPEQIKYDVNLGGEFDFIFIDGPSLDVDGVKHKKAVNSNIFDIAQRKLPQIIVVDIRKATVEELKKRLGEKYDVFVSDVIAGRIYKGYRYFSIFRLKS